MYRHRFAGRAANQRHTRAGLHPQVLCQNKLPLAPLASKDAASEESRAAAFHEITVSHRLACGWAALTTPLGMPVRLRLAWDSDVLFSRLAICAGCSICWLLPQAASPKACLWDCSLARRRCRGAWKSCHRKSRLLLLLLQEDT